MFLFFLIMPCRSFGMAAMTLLLMFLYIAYAVYILVVTYRTYPAIMVEGTVAVSGIRRSGSLSKGQFCHFFLVLFIWWLVRCDVNTLVTSTFETNGDGIAAGARSMDATLHEYHESKEWLTK